MIHEYFPGMKTIGGFARITDIAMESDEEIRQGNWGEESETEKYREIRALMAREYLIKCQSISFKRSF